MKTQKKEADMHHLIQRFTPLVRRQRGAVVVLVAAGLVAIIGMAGLALDLGDSYWSKTRLQNALDAAALSGAKTLDQGGTTVQADTDAVTTFNQHPDMSAAGLTPVTEFSATLNPFTPGATETSVPPAKYVRAFVANYPLAVGFASVLGITSRSVAGTAVAGPRPICAPPPPNPPVCDLAPIMMCGDANNPDTDCSDGACFGYPVPSNPPNPEAILKTGAGSGWAVGPGNFQLVQLSCGTGGACVRDAMAGGSQCLTNASSVTTKPGNTVGPVSQGLNTRFNIYQGPVSSAQYPPDTVTYYDPNANTNASPPTLNTFWYTSGFKGGYKYYTPPDVPPQTAGIGVPERRILAVPIGDCTGTTNGQGNVPVLGFGCFFMTRPAAHQGNVQEVYGELIGQCAAAGPGPTPGPNPCTTPTPFVEIVLFNDPGGDDS